MPSAVSITHGLASDMNVAALHSDRPILGQWMRVASILAFSGMALCVKLAADDVPTGQIVFYRSFFAMIPLVGFLWLRGEFPNGLRTSRPLGHLMRCLAGCAAMFTAFASLRYLPLADYTLIGFLAPFATMILARILLSEHVDARKWAGIGIGFAGVIALVWPELRLPGQREGYLLGVALGIATAALTAVAKIQIRSLSRTESAGAIAFYFALTCTVVGAATATLEWNVVDLTQLSALISAGILGGIAHILMTLGIQFCPLSRQAGLDYLALVFAVLLDVAVLAIVPDAWSLAATVLVLSAAWMSFRNRA